MKKQEEQKYLGKPARNNEEVTEKKKSKGKKEKWEIRGHGKEKTESFIEEKR